MNSSYFHTVLLTMVLITGLSNTAWAEEEKRNSIFSITPAVSFAWYPYAYFLKQESIKTEADINNFGISALMGLKLFDKVGVQLGIKIDDPTFKKMVDFAGYINVYSFIINFDYHTYGGTVTWEGSTPNPISGGSYFFRGHWTNISLLYNLLPVFMKDYPQLIAIGITYTSFETPLEYRVKKDSKLNPGFGLVKFNAWGISILMDTLVGAMELSPEAKERSLFKPLKFRDYNLNLWMYFDIFYGLYLQKGEIDAKALAWMVNANDGASIDGDITRNFKIFANDENGDDSNGVFKLSLILGIQKVWDLGKKTRIGLAGGVGFGMEKLYTSSDDIIVGFNSMYIGPVVRFSARW